MLTNLYLSSFKCFAKLELELRPLTLLAGVNGGGKSSVIQALALLTQTLVEREWGRTLLLEGPDLALGSAADVLNQRSPRRQLAIGASTASEHIIWGFKVDDRRALSIELEEVVMNGETVWPTEPMRWLLPSSRATSSGVVAALRRLSWITAERVGPRELLPLRDRHSHTQVGARGELAAGLLYWRDLENDAGDAPGDVIPELCVPDAPPTLFHQVRARMQEFFPGCDLRVSPVEGASAVSLRLRTDSRAEFQRPQNVGFGLTQLFPIVVAVLAARPGDVILVENPEVHLHPRAQQRIGSLLASVAASGVQVIVETHSDHVLNGVRLAVKQRAIGPESVAMHFFGPALTGGEFVPVSPKIDVDGKLDAWPEGFFDQLDLALSELL